MWCLWSAKGGSGCSVMSAAAAVMMSRRHQVLLVDLGGGGLASVLGLEPGPVGLQHWLARADAPIDALARMEIDAGANLRLLGWAGREAEPSTVPSGDEMLVRFRQLGLMLNADHRSVIVDLGDLGRLDAFDRLSRRGVVRESARRVTLVTRLCYQAVVAATLHPKPDDVVVVAEPGRALRVADLRSALGVEQFATIRWDPAIARAADSGLLGRRLPRPLLRLPIDVVAEGSFS